LQAHGPELVLLATMTSNVDNTRAGHVMAQSRDRDGAACSMTGSGTKPHRYDRRRREVCGDVKAL